GMMLWSYIVWYTLGRIPIESIRLDKAQTWSLFGLELRTNTWTSVVMFLIAVALLIYSIANRPKTPEEWAEANKLYRDDRDVAEEVATPDVVDDTADNPGATTDDDDPDRPRS